MAGKCVRFASMLNLRLVNGAARRFAFRNLLIYAIMMLTLISIFGIASRMAALRNDIGFSEYIPHHDPRRVEFNRLHEWSTRVEGAVMLLGLVLVWVTARRIT